MKRLSETQGIHDLHFSRSRELQRQSHKLIPGGCHTYAKGDDQFPELAPGFIARGAGCHVWDVDGNEYIEYGMGCRAVSLGHAFRPVVNAAKEEMSKGSNFTRPSPIEVRCAQQLLEMIDGAEMVKFVKDGSPASSTGRFRLLWLDPSLMPLPNTISVLSKICASFSREMKLPSFVARKASTT